MYVGKIVASGGEYLQALGSTIYLTTDIKKATIWTLKSYDSYVKIQAYPNGNNGGVLSIDIWDVVEPDLVLHGNNPSENQKFEIEMKSWNKIKLQSKATKQYLKVKLLNNEFILSVSPTNASILTLIDMKKPTQHLAVATFNLAFGVQKNEIYKTSEMVMVERCNARYKETSGWSEEWNLSECTRNAADGLLNGFFPREINVDVIGIQEAHTPSMPNFLRYLQSNSDENKTRFVLVGKGACSIIYNEVTMGRGRSFDVYLKHGYKGLRDGKGVYFSESGLLFLNFWFDHRINIKRILEEGLDMDDLRYIKQIRNTRRVIMTMDSNDHEGSYRDSEIHFQGFVLKSSNSMKTCCEDSDYEFYGDYIFDSEPGNAIFQEIPENVTGETQYMSDHLPVILLTEK